MIRVMAYICGGISMFYVIVLKVTNLL